MTVCFVCEHEIDGVSHQVQEETVCADAYSRMKRFEENLNEALKEQKNSNH